MADELLGQDKRPLEPSIRLELSRKYSIPFSIRGLPMTRKFVDRSAEMQSLEEALLLESNTDRCRMFVLRGLGGIGKTQLAIEFIRRHHSNFSAVLWLDGSSEDSLKQSLARYAGRIAPDQISEASKTYAHCREGNVDAVVQEVLRWLAAADNDAWLLVFDNVDGEVDCSKSDPSAYDVEQYLPDADHGSVLITTRLTQLEQLGESQEVRKVDNRTAQAILRSWYKKSYGKYASFTRATCYTSTDLFQMKMKASDYLSTLTAYLLPLHKLVHIYMKVG